VTEQIPDLDPKTCKRVIIDVTTVKDRKAPWKVPGVSRFVKDVVAVRPMSCNGAIVPERQVTDTKGWTEERIRTQLETVKKHLGWATTAGNARQWWVAFEDHNVHRPALVLRLAEELYLRRSTIADFFLAYVYSNCDNIQANLHFLDYRRLKKKEDDQKKSEQDKGPARDSQ